jgi:hypothetical protein
MASGHKHIFEKAFRASAIAHMLLKERNSQEKMNCKKTRYFGKLTLSCTNLAHELRDDPVEGGPLVSESLFSGAKGPEVFRRFRHDVGPKLEHDAAHLLAVGGHVEVDLWKESLIQAFENLIPLVLI